MSELKKYKLGDLGFFFGGVTSIKKEDYGHGTPFLPYKNVYKNSKVNVNELELMNVRPLDLERRNAVYGDIFFTASSETPDEVAMSSVLLDEVENLTFNGFCKRFRLNDFNTLLPEYARYLFRDISFRRQVYQLATGDIRFNISQESLANIEIEIPDTDTQKEIAQILTSLDDKIELNLQMNQTLEAMAQAIFKEWFVNFNFPGFDGELVDGLPKGWRIGKIGEYITVTDYVANGSFASLKENVTLYDEKEYALYVRTTDNNSGFSGSLKYIDKPSFEFLKKSRLFGNEVIISNVGDVGTVFRPPVWLKQPMTLGSNAIMITEHYLNDYLFFKLASNEGQHSISGLISGSAQPKFNKTAFRNMEIKIPPKDVVIEFNNLYQPIKEKLNQNKGQIEILKITRDTLLPKLMSGSLEIN